MNQQSYQAITTMLNAFPQSAADIRGLLLTYDQALSGVSDQAIKATALRFIAGEISGQSKTFAPSIAEFTQEAKRIADLQSYQSRPKLTAPYRPRSHLAPYEIKAEQLRQKYADREILHTDVSYDQWRAMRDKLPFGHTWIGALGGTIFGPKPEERKEAAE